MELFIYRTVLPGGEGISYCEIEVRRNPMGTFFYSQLVIPSGASWEADPATIQEHDTPEESAAVFGLTFSDFKQVDYQEHVY